MGLDECGLVRHHGVAAPRRAAMPAIPDDLLSRLAAHQGARAETPAPRRAAVAAVLRTGELGPEVLLMRRTEHPQDPWSGHVSFPGGNQDPGDGDLLATAVRETHEEVGLILAQDMLLCRLDPVTAVGRRLGFHMDITPFVFRVQGEVTAVAGPEAQEVFWLPLAPAVRGDYDDEHRWDDGDLVRRLPAWRFEERVVWGLTYRMIRSLLEAGGVPVSRPGSPPAT